MYVEYQVQKYASINVNALGSTNLVAGVPGRQIVVVAFKLVVGAAVSAKFVSNGGTPSDLTGAMPFAANGGVGGAWCPAGHFATAAGEPLALNLSVAAQVSGCLTYVLA